MLIINKWQVFLIYYVEVYCNRILFYIFFLNFFQGTENTLDINLKNYILLENVILLVFKNACDSKPKIIDQ